jgi:tetratricopeptide (TPR) repeat protein
MQALKAGEFGKAEQLFSMLVKEKPSAASFNLLAMSESAEGKLDQAIGHFRRSIELGNDTAAVHYDLGLAYLKQHESALGTREIQRALSVEPDLKKARYTLAVALLEAGQPREAIPHFLRLREESPCDAAVFANLARAYFEVGDGKGAKRTIDEATRGMPRNVRLTITLAMLCARYREFQKARHLLENANELMPDDPDIKMLLAKTSLQAGEPIEALAVLKDVPASGHSSGVLSFTRGVALALTEQEEAAATELSAAVSAEPQNVRYLVAQAWVYQLEQRHDEALAVLNRARGIDPRASIVYYRMAVSYFFLRHYPQAVECCEHAIRCAPQYDRAFLLLGVVNMEAGDLRDAQSAIRQAVALKPNTALYHRELGVSLFKDGNLGESKRELDEALTLDSQAAQSYFWRARVLTGLKNLEGAIADLQTATALQPNDQEVLAELAQLYSKTGQPQKAAEIAARQKEIKKTTTPDDRGHFLIDLADPLL